CAYLLKPVDEQRHGWMYRLSERGFDWVLGRYEASLGWVLRHQRLTIFVTLLTIAFTIYLYYVVPKGFFPQQDTGRLAGSIQADQDTSFQAMNQRLTQLCNVVREDPAVTKVIAFAGGGGSAINSGRMFVTLKPQDQRGLTADQVMGRLRGKVSRIP